MVDENFTWIDHINTSENKLSRKLRSSIQSKIIFKC